MFIIVALCLCVGASTNEAFGGCSPGVGELTSAGDRTCAALLQLKSTRHGKKKDMPTAEEETEEEDDEEEEEEDDEKPDVQEGTEHPGVSSADDAEGVQTVSLADSRDNVESHIGSSAPLDNEGYTMVARTKDTKEMESFMKRLISSMGLRIQDDGGLHGVIPYFDGRRSVQSFAKLQDEIERASKRQNGWVTAQQPAVNSVLQEAQGHTLEAFGETAPLTEKGYRQVAQMQSSREMAKFVRRAASDLGLHIKDEGGLSGFSPWYSGEKDSQSFGRLETEVMATSKNHTSWLSRAP